MSFMMPCGIVTAAQLRYQRVGQEACEAVEAIGDIYERLTAEVTERVASTLGSDDGSDDGPSDDLQRAIDTARINLAAAYEACVMDILHAAGTDVARAMQETHLQP